MTHTVLITGASAGIGEATAKRFAKEGHHLILAARRKDKLEALKKELKVPVETIVLDVRDRDSVVSTLSQLAEKYPIDILINNAGLAWGLEPAYKASLDDWEDMIDCNIKGLIYCTHVLLPHMVLRNQGHIINLGSVAGSYAYAGGNIYGGTKAFVHQFSFNLRADLLGTQVRVSCIEPGLVGHTEFSQVRFRGDAQKAKEVYAKTTPLSPEDIAEAIYWCSSLPPHVNINSIELMPVCQASAGLVVKRE